MTMVVRRRVDLGKIHKKKKKKKGKLVRIPMNESKKVGGEEGSNLAPG